MSRRRSLLVTDKEKWTYEAEWNTESDKRLQIIFNTSLNSYDSNNNLIFDVQGTGNFQITPRQKTNNNIRAMWECDINIIEPAEINGWKMTINLYGLLRTQIYVIKSATEGFASVMYDDGIKDSEAHNLENGILIKDIPINTFNHLKIVATRINSYNALFEIFINDKKEYETGNVSSHYATETRCMFQYQGKALLQSLKYAYQEG